MLLKASKILSSKLQGHTEKVDIIGGNYIKNTNKSFFNSVVFRQGAVLCKRINRIWIVSKFTFCDKTNSTWDFHPSTLSRIRTRRGSIYQVVSLHRNKQATFHFRQACLSSRHEACRNLAMEQWGEESKAGSVGSENPWLQGRVWSLEQARVGGASGNTGKSPRQGVRGKITWGKVALGAGGNPFAGIMTESSLQQTSGRQQGMLGADPALSPFPTTVGRLCPARRHPGPAPGTLPARHGWQWSPRTEESHGQGRLHSRDLSDKPRCTLVCLYSSYQ